MKAKIFLLLAFLILTLLLTYTISFAKSKALTIDSFEVSQGSLSGEYEQKLTNNYSFAVQAVTDKDRMDDLEYQGIGGALGIKYYLSQTPLNGTYLGFFGSIVNLNITQPTKGKVTCYGLAGSLGYKWIDQNGFTVDIGFSLALPVLTKISTEESELQDSVRSGPLGKGINLGLGFAW